MPNYPKLTWEDKDLGISMRPSGTRGWYGIRRIMPYLTSDVLRLTLFVDKAKVKERGFHYTWVLLQHLPSGNRTQIQSHEGSFISSLNHGVVSPSGTARIIAPGHYSFLLELTTDGENPSAIRQTMVIFTAFSGDKILISIYGAILTIIGGLIGHFCFG